MAAQLEFVIDESKSQSITHRVNVDAFLLADSTLVDSLPYTNTAREAFEITPGVVCEADFTDANGEIASQFALVVQTAKQANETPSVVLAWMLPYLNDESGEHFVCDPADNGVYDLRIPGRILCPDHIVRRRRKGRKRSTVVTSSSEFASMQLIRADGERGALTRAAVFATPSKPAPSPSSPGPPSLSPQPSKKKKRPAGTEKHEEVGDKKKKQKKQLKKTQEPGDKPPQPSRLLKADTTMADADEQSEAITRAKRKRPESGDPPIAGKRQRHVTSHSENDGDQGAEEDKIKRDDDGDQGAEEDKVKRGDDGDQGAEEDKAKGHDTSDAAAAPDADDDNESDAAAEDAMVEGDDDSDAAAASDADDDDESDSAAEDAMVEGDDDSDGAAAPDADDDDEPDDQVTR